MIYKLDKQAQLRYGRAALFYQQKAMSAGRGRSHMRDDLNINGGLTLVPMPGHEEQANEVKLLIETMDKPGRRTTVDIAIPEWGLHSNNEPFLELTDKHINGHDVIILASGPGTYKMLMQLRFLAAQLRGKHARRVSAVFGYSPLSRSDKDEGPGRLTWAGLPYQLLDDGMGPKRTIHRLVVADPHCEQISMIGPQGTVVSVTMIRRLIRRAVEEAQRRGITRICLAFADDGSSKRYEKKVDEVLREFAEDGITFDTFVGYQRRTDSYKKEATHIVPCDDEARAALRDSLVISIDDEIATAGTNQNVARIFKETYGAKLFWAVVPHGILCNPATERLSHPDCPIDLLMITDTCPLERKDRQHIQALQEIGRVHVVKWTEDLAKIVFFLHWDTSIRAMR